MFGPDLICDAPRLIHDSRVYPNLHFCEQELGDVKWSRSRHEQSVKHNMLSTIRSRTALCLPHGYGSTEDANAESNDRTANDELCKSKRRSAQRLADEGEGGS